MAEISVIRNILYDMWTAKPPLSTPRTICARWFPERFDDISCVNEWFPTYEEGNGLIILNRIWRDMLMGIFDFGDPRTEDKNAPRQTDRKGGNIMYGTVLWMDRGI